MKTFTNAEIRGAILRAADRIEQTPTSYNFMEVELPRDGNCGSPHCMLGWIGFEIGSKHRMAHQVAMELAGFKFSNKYSLDNSYASAFYDFCKTVDSEYQKKPLAAVRCMRAYANKYYPAESKAVSAWVRQDVTDWSSCAWRPSKVAT